VWDGVLISFWCDIIRYTTPAGVFEGGSVRPQKRRRGGDGIFIFS